MTYIIKIGDVLVHKASGEKAIVIKKDDRYSYSCPFPSPIFVYETGYLLSFGSGKDKWVKEAHVLLSYSPLVLEE